MTLEQGSATGDDSQPVAPAAPTATQKRRASGPPPALFVGLGIFGLVVCLVIVAATWYARGVAVTQTDLLYGTVDSAIASGVTITGSVVDRASKAEQAAAAVQAAAANPRSFIANLPAVEALRTQLVDGINSKLAPVREAYAGVKAKVTTAIEAANRVGNLLPGVSVPDIPTDLLASIDQKLTDINASVTTITQPAAPGTDPQVQAGVVAKAAATLESAFANLGQALTSFQDRLTSLRGSASDFRDRIVGLTNVAAVGLTLLFGYFLLLHAGLIWFGLRPYRRLRHEAAAASAAPAG